MNILQEWEISYKEGILRDIKEAGIKLTLRNIPQIIKETSYSVRKRKYPDKCPYYSIEHACHPEIKDLNCFLCACPNYNPKKETGGCKINSKFGKFNHHKNLPKGKVWDCSDCPVNHSPKEIEDYLRKNINLLAKIAEQL